jgi:hypothetical protein
MISGGVFGFVGGEVNPVSGIIVGDTTVFVILDCSPDNSQNSSLS